MKKYFVHFEWTLGDTPQDNTLPTWASTETNALNIARTRLFKMAQATGERFSIKTETVNE